MCDVPSTAVLCSESIECFPGTASKFFLKILVTIPVAPIIIGITVHFRFHIRCIFINKLLYFNFFSASFCTIFLCIIIIIIIINIIIIILQLPIALLYQQVNKQDLKRTKLNNDYGYISSCFFTYYRSLQG